MGEHKDVKHGLLMAFCIVKLVGVCREDAGGVCREDAGGVCREDAGGVCREDAGGVCREDAGGVCKEDAGGVCREDAGEFLFPNCEVDPSNREQNHCKAGINRCTNEVFHAFWTASKHIGAQLTE
jgi:hypothetical protein